MTEYYDVALLISPECTVADVHRILDELDDMDVYYDWQDLEFYDDGMSFTARFHEPTTVQEIEAIDGLVIDWDSMADWDPYEVDE